MDEISTEQKIYSAAKQIFLQKGLQGARMQEIADEAGINKSLLHYYFRTKDKLFQVIFEETASKLFTSIITALEGGNDFKTKIQLFVDRYIGFIQENPYIPQFMINIISQNPDMLLQVFEKLKIQPKNDILKQIQMEMDKGNIKKMQPEQLIINMVSLCIFPFIAKPIIKGILEKNDDEYDDLMNERKKMLPDFIINAIQFRK
jgi:AcrR family transcriptional regulator